MKRKIAALLICCAALGIVTVITSSSRNKGTTSQQTIERLKDKEKRQSLSFKERAQLAKAKGERKITVPGIATLYPNASSPEELREILFNHTVVVAEPILQESYVSQQGGVVQDSPSEFIRTWYKFRILEVISQAPPSPSYAVRKIPQALLPINNNEVLISKEGGVVLIDGVEVIQHDEDVAAFKANKKYLLILSLDPSTRIGELAFGPQSILPINGDGTLEDGQDQHILQRTLKKFYKGSIGHLKQQAKD